MVPFVRNDFEALERNFTMHPVQINKNIVKSIVNLVRFALSSDIIFVWFAGFQALLSVFLAKLFQRKMVVVAGGYDAAYVPEINYGAFIYWYRAAVAYFVFKESDVIIAVSESTKKEVLQRLTPKRIVVIYNGIDTDLFMPKGEKERIVLTVGAVTDSNLKKKGLETFVKTAGYLPEIQFVLAGRYDTAMNDLRKISSSNVEFTGYISFEKLLSLYRRSKVCAQLSYHESFGVALAEAMACECVPIVTRRAALPEVVGDCGIYVPYGNAEETAKAVIKALREEELGKRARERITRFFTLQERERKLVELVNAL
jgi:glycosyltransferase involved in cell wall biosynthesis